MAELMLDVHLELDPFELAKEHDPTRAVAELSRREAELQCEEKRARLRHAEPVDVVTRTATTLDGREAVLVSTRWVADGPEH